MFVRLVVDVLQQFHHGQTALTEACDDKWARLVTMFLEMIEGCADISHRQAGTVIDSVLVLRQERLDGGVTVERGEEAVTWRHISRHLEDLERPHALTVHGVPHVGIVARAPVICLPILFPRRYHVEDGTRVVGIAVGGHPHRRIVVVRCLRNILNRYNRLDIVVIRLTKYITYDAAEGQDGGEHP